MVVFVAKHVQNFASTAEPLYRLLKGDQEFIFGEDQKRAFDKIKQMLVEAPVLALFDEGCKQTFVSSDASDRGIGAVLTQIQNGKEKPISYASRLLTPYRAEFVNRREGSSRCFMDC